MLIKNSKTMEFRVTKRWDGVKASFFVVEQGMCESYKIYIYHDLWKGWCNKEKIYTKIKKYTVKITYKIQIRSYLTNILNNINDTCKEKIV